MKTTLTILAATMVALPAFAETTPAADFNGVPAISSQRLSGAFVVGADTNYVGRGIVISHSVAEGDGSEFAALRLNYDIGKKRQYWTLGSTLLYRSVHSGHTLYGNPSFGSARHKAGAIEAMTGMAVSPEVADKALPDKIKQANLENEFVVQTEAAYTRKQWNVTFGHRFVHGGILGVMAKHYRDQGASCTNEVFVKPEWTPTPWLDLGVSASFSFQGITGWWFEPYATFKAPVIGSPEDLTLAARLTFAMSATAEYFNEGYFACSNGSQAFWIKLDTPWFVTQDKNLVVTPYISCNWLGKGAVKANRDSEYRKLSGNYHNYPFRNFGVVAGVSVMYKF